MIHDASHDPIAQARRCEVCAASLRRAFNAMAQLSLGPKDCATIVHRIRQLASDMDRESWELEHLRDQEARRLA